MMSRPHSRRPVERRRFSDPPDTSSSTDDGFEPHGPSTRNTPKASPALALLAPRTDVVHGNRGSGNGNQETLAEPVGNDDITPMKGDDRWREPRRRMVEEQLRRRGLRDTRVLDAMMSVPREVFVPPDQLERAYEDRALPIGYSQTISQPYIVAYMTHQLSLKPASKVLEIGTGTGYQTAILALLAGSVFTVERLPELQTEAATNLRNLGLTKVTMEIGDGSVGLPNHAPYDRIMVTAAAPRVPGSLVGQWRSTASWSFRWEVRPSRPLCV